MFESKDRASISGNASQGMFLRKFISGNTSQGIINLSESISESVLCTDNIPS
jgi:hypothetical protein